MHEILKQIVGRNDAVPSRSSRILGLSKVLGGMLFLALIYNPVEARGATPPVSYSVTLAWGRSPDSDVTGYRIYYGVESGIYTNSISAGNATTSAVTGLASGVTYFFVVTAYNSIGLESLPSNEVSYVPGLARVGIRVTPAGQAVLTVKGLTGQTYDILASQTLTDWTVIGTVTLDASGSADYTDPNAASFSKRFYRTQQKP
jgi:hypothetical protein